MIKVKTIARNLRKSLEVIRDFGPAVIGTSDAQIRYRPDLVGTQIDLDFLEVLRLVSTRPELIEQVYLQSNIGSEVKMCIQESGKTVRFKCQDWLLGYWITWNSDTQYLCIPFWGVGVYSSEKDSDFEEFKEDLLGDDNNQD